MTFCEGDTTGYNLKEYLFSIHKVNTRPCPQWCDLDEVYPNIFIGDGMTAKNKRYLLEIGITHVLNTAEGLTAGYVSTNKAFYSDTPIEYLGFELMDLPNEDIYKYFEKGAEFIDKGIESGGRVYVHCLMGMSRSASMVIAYLMLKKGLSAKNAIKTVRESRSVFPNLGFIEQIAILDNELRRERLRNCHPF